MDTMEKFDLAVAKYLHRCEKNRLSPNTVENYRRHLSAFRSFMERTGVKQIGFDTVEEWRDAMEEEGREPSTINRYLGDLSIFFSALQKSSYPEHLRYAENYVSEDFYVRQQRRPYDHILPSADVSLLWRNRCPDGRLRANWPRNYAIVVTLLSQKIRCSELLDLRLSDIHFDEEYMVIRSGKGGKYRELDLEPICATAIRLYLQSGIRPSGLSDEDYLFGSTADKVKGDPNKDRVAWHRGTRQWVSQLVERHVAAVTGHEGYRSHAMRHAGAVINLNTGVTKEQIQADLGHSSIAVTEIYTSRLQTRRNRDAAQEAAAERDRQAARNEELLAIRSVAEPRGGECHAHAI